MRDPLHPMRRAVSWYSYCGSRPTGAVDPNGAQSCPGFDDDWVLGQVLGPRNDPYLTHFPDYVGAVLGAFAKCMADCMNPVTQLCVSGAIYGIGKLIGGRVGGIIAGPVGWGLTAADAIYCFCKCDTMEKLDPYMPKRWKTGE